MKFWFFQAGEIKIKTTCLLFHFSVYCTVLEAQLLPLYFYKLTAIKPYY